MKYVLAVLILSVIVIVHEFGHFILAKACGVKVLEFSVGMGPRLLKWTRKGTMYSIKLFLFGGSCRMLGEDEDDDGEGSFNSVSVWKRMAIVVAGPMFNFILAIVLSIIFIGKMGYQPCQIYSVDELSSAEEAGLAKGDKIVKINNKSINFYDDYYLYSLDHSGDTMKIVYERDGKKYNTTLIPRYVDKDVYQLGITIDTTYDAGDNNISGVKVSGLSDNMPAADAGIKSGDIVVKINQDEITGYEDLTETLNKYGKKEISVTVYRDGDYKTYNMTPEAIHQTYYETGLSMANVWEHVSPLKTVGYSFNYTGYWIKAVFKSFKLLFTGKASVNDLSGPVGIVTMVGDIVTESSNDGSLYVVMNLIIFSIMISANLGIMNLLPLPALDGGRLVFLIIEAVRKKPVPRDKEGMVHFVGIVLLMILMVFVMFNDIRKLF